MTNAEVLREVSLDEIKEAHERIKPYIHETPLLTSSSLSKWQNGTHTLYYKCENFNKVGAFKIRGATNATLKYISQNTTGNKSICTHSSGNHAQAVACAAQNFGISAHIIMPKNAPSVKLSAVRDTYEAQVYLSEPTQQAREELCSKIMQETNSHFIHPYDDYDVIVGQGTVFLEMYNQFKQQHGEDAHFDAIICPVGGGGLMSGVSTCCKELLGEKCKVYGAEPLNANDAQRSLKSGRLIENEAPPKTICDGLLTNMKEKTWTIIRKNVSDIFTVTEEEVTKAMKLVWERMKIVIEPSSATVVAVALFNEEFRSLGHKRVGLIIGGGNVDLSKLPWY